MANGLGVTTAIFHITYNCSHFCPMCYANAKHDQEHPSLKKLKRIIDKLACLGVMDITLVGGDPACYPDILPLAQYAKAKGFKITVLSNTLDFTPSNEDVLDFFDIYEGTIHHSIGSHHDKFCGYDGAYTKLLSNLRFFSEHGKNVGIAINLIPYNIDVIYDMAANVVSHGIKLDHIVFQRIIQMGRAQGISRYELDRGMLDKAMQQIAMIEEHFNTSILFEDPIPACAIRSEYQKYMRPCEWGISKVSIDYNGNLSRCGADVFHTFGSIFDEQIIEKWMNAESLTAFRDRSYLPNSCKTCSSFVQCAGGCPISRNPEKGYSLDYLAEGAHHAV